MKKLSILFLCIMLCGCTTFNKAELKKHNSEIYRDGIRMGYIMCLHDSIH